MINAYRQLPLLTGPSPSLTDSPGDLGQKETNIDVSLKEYHVSGCKKKIRNSAGIQLIGISQLTEFFREEFLLCILCETEVSCAFKTCLVL